MARLQTCCGAWRSVARWHAACCARCCPIGSARGVSLRAHVVGASLARACDGGRWYQLLAARACYALRRVHGQRRRCGDYGARYQREWQGDSHRRNLRQLRRGRALGEYPKCGAPSAERRPRQRRLQGDVYEATLLATDSMTGSFTPITWKADAPSVNVKSCDPYCAHPPLHLWFNRRAVNAEPVETRDWCVDSAWSGRRMRPRCAPSCRCTATTRPLALRRTSAALWRRQTPPAAGGRRRAAKCTRSRRKRRSSDDDCPRATGRATVPRS